MDDTPRIHSKRKIIVVEVIEWLALLSIFGITFISINNYATAAVICIGYIVGWAVFFWAEKKLKTMDKENFYGKKDRC
jgi:hypothetical protein